MTPVQTQLIVNAPPPVTVSAPDTTELVRVYTEEILPLSSYRIDTPAQYVKATQDWNKAKDFAKAIDTLFDQSVKLAHQTHKSLTTLRESLKAPAVQIADHVGKEIKRFSEQEERKRREEEARLQAIENARVEAERAAALAAANAERGRLLAERAEATADLDPWEVDEESLPPVPEPVTVDIAPPPPVRIASTIPTVLGGPKIVQKPWEARVTDPVALLKWVLENPAERIGACVEFRMPWFNSKARELGADMSRVIPGTEAVREQTLKRV